MSKAAAAKEVKAVGDSHEQLKAAFATGKTKGYAWRYAQLAALKQLLVEKEADIKAALAEDLHRHPFEAVGLEIIGSLVEVEYMLANLKEWMKPDYTDVPLWLAPASSEIVCEPFGVCLILCPFNYPVTLTLGPLMGALAAGNCVLVKPSEMTSATEKLMMDLIPRYLDGECVKVVAGGVNITSALLQLRWDKIFFTGSPRVGKIVMKAAAEHLTPVSLELGGKSPTIIDESVGDLELAAQRVMWGKCANAGQTCIAPDYVFCHEKHYDKFLALCASKLQQFYGPDPQQAPDYGRIVSKEHVQRLQGMLKEVGQQAVVTGGTVDEADKYVAPTILTGVPMNSKLMTEEIFGPLLPVHKYSDLSTVLDHVAKGEKPLTIYIFARNRRNIDRITSTLSSGSVVVNDALVQFLNNYAPFGGVGESGIGGYHGKFSFSCFSHHKSILRRDDHMLLDVPFRYPPYTDFGLSFFGFALRLPYTQPRGLGKSLMWLVSVAAATGVAVAFLKGN